jgi:hypothetical protein
MISPISSSSVVPDRFSLDPNLDFVVRDGGVIELTKAGFRRLAQAHSAGFDAVIEIDNRVVLRFPGREA